MMHNNRYGGVSIWAMAVLLLTVAAIGVVLLLNHHGVGLTGDSGSYFSGAMADSWAALPVHHAPFYSVVLKIGTVGGGRLQSAAVWINAICAALTVMLVALGCRYVAAASAWSAWLAGFGVLGSFPFLYVQAFAASESLFLMLQFAGLLAFGCYWRQHRIGWLIVAGGLFTLTIWTRYAGIYLPVVAVALLVWMHRGERGIAVRRLLVFGAVVAAGILLLAGFNSVRAGTWTNRVFQYHSAPDAWQEAGLNLLNLGLPYGLIAHWPAARLAVVGLVGIFGLSGWLMRRSAAGFGLIWFAAGYAALLVISKLFFDRWTQMEHRILAPISSLLIVAGVLAADAEWRRRPAGLARVLIAGGLCYFMLFTTWRAQGYIRRSYANGNGLAAAAWRTSPLRQAVENWPAAQRIYSNAAYEYFLITGQDRLVGIPRKQDPASSRPLPDYERQMDELADAIEQGKAVVAIFYLVHNPAQWCHYLPTINEMKARLRTEVLAEYPDGIILGKRKGGTRQPE